MEIFITGLHISLCFFLILVVLLQPGKGADFGAAMGGASQEVFGATGGVSLLSKITGVVAAMFMATSLSLAWFSNAPPGTDLTPEELLKGVDLEQPIMGSTDPDPQEGEAAKGAADTTEGAADSTEPAAEGAKDSTDPNPQEGEAAEGAKGSTEPATEGAGSSEPATEGAGSSEPATEGVE